MVKIDLALYLLNRASGLVVRSLLWLLEEGKDSFRSGKGELESADNLGERGNRAVKLVDILNKGLKTADGNRL